MYIFTMHIRGTLYALLTRYIQCTLEVVKNALNSSQIEEDKANTRDPSAPQQEATRSQMGTSTPLETTEAAGFGSDTSSRKEADDNDELGQAEAN